MSSTSSMSKIDFRAIPDSFLTMPYHVAECRGRDANQPDDPQHNSIKHNMS
jgi:hypothetical protein